MSEHGPQCSRCHRRVPWLVPGVKICGGCRDVGLWDGWLRYDANTGQYIKVGLTPEPQCGNIKI